MAAPESKKQQWDYILLLVTLILMGGGLVMVLSSSSMLAQQRFGDPYHFFRPQVAYALFGLAVMLAIKHVPYQLFTRLAYPMLLVTLILLGLVLIPEIGHRVGGASRWLRFGRLSFQPSELAKLTLVVYLAYSLAAKRDRIKDFSVGLFPHLVILGLLVGMVVVEPDLGSAITMCLLAFVLFFAAGVRVSYLFCLMTMAVPVVYFLIIRHPYRLKRIIAFLDPWQDPLGAGYHIIHSFFAFASGGLTGLGPGNGQQKLLFLPEPHTDFILAVVGEELGFVGVAFVALLFLILVVRGIQIALAAYDLEGTYLALGLTLIIGLQAFMNMAVVVGLLPTKGLILPFFSYGGSAMLVNFIAMGILLNVAGQSRPRAA